MGFQGFTLETPFDIYIPATAFFKVENLATVIKNVCPVASLYMDMHANINLFHFRIESKYLMIRYVYFKNFCTQCTNGMPRNKYRFDNFADSNCYAE